MPSELSGSPKASAAFWIKTVIRARGSGLPSLSLNKMSSASGPPGKRAGNASKSSIAAVTGHRESPVR